MLSIFAKMSEYCIEPKKRKIMKTPRPKPKSPKRLTMKAFLPASAALFFSYQKPIRK